MNEKKIMQEQTAKLEDICQRMYEWGKASGVEQCEIFSRELQAVSSELKTYILGYFERIGTSKSMSRKLASSQNGKKGGRPPKEISEANKRIREILNAGGDLLNNPELDQLQAKVDEWKKSKPKS